MGCLEKKKGKTEGSKVIAVIVVVIIILPCLIFLKAVLWYAVSSDSGDVRYAEFDAYLTIGNHTGFDVNTSSLYYGTLMPGQSETRYILLQSTDKTISKFTVVAEGNLSSWMIFERDYFVIAGQNATANITVNVPGDASLGNYSGKIKIYQTVR